jgi:hypothetical protein
VTDGIFILRPHVEHRDEAVPEALHQLLARDRLQRIALMEVASDDVANLRKMAFSDMAQCGGQVEHRRIAQPIDDAFAVAARGEQTGPLHKP